MKAQQNENQYVFCKLILVLSALFNSNSFSQNNSGYSVTSPDKKISVYFHISNDKQVFYRITYDDTAILQDSRLGITREDEDFSKELFLRYVSDVEVVKIEEEHIGGWIDSA